MIVNNLTPSESTPAFSSIRKASFEQCLQNPFLPLTTANSPKLVQFLQTAFGQHKHQNLDVLPQQWQKCEPAKNNLFENNSVSKELEDILLKSLKHELTKKTDKTDSIMTNNKCIKFPTRLPIPVQSSNCQQNKNISYNT